MSGPLASLFAGQVSRVFPFQGTWRHGEIDITIGENNKGTISRLDKSFPITLKLEGNQFSFDLAGDKVVFALVLGKLSVKSPKKLAGVYSRVYNVPVSETQGQTVESKIQTEDQIESKIQTLEIESKTEDQTEIQTETQIEIQTEQIPDENNEDEDEFEDE